MKVGLKKLKSLDYIPDGEMRTIQLSLVLTHSAYHSN